MSELAADIDLNAVVEAGVDLANNVGAFRKGTISSIEDGFGWIDPASEAKVSLNFEIQSDIHGFIDPIKFDDFGENSRYNIELSLQTQQLVDDWPSHVTDEERSQGNELPSVMGNRLNQIRALQLSVSVSDLAWMELEDYMLFDADTDELITGVNKLVDRCDPSEDILVGDALASGNENDEIFLQICSGLDLTMLDARSIIRARQSLAIIKTLHDREPIELQPLLAHGNFVKLEPNSTDDN